MKGLVLLGVIFLTGCGSTATLEQLEEQAFLTGDWSAVEQRERIIAKRNARRAPKCPAGFVSYCETRVGQRRCACIDREQLSAALSFR